MCRNDDNATISDNIRFVDVNEFAKTPIVNYIYAVFMLFLSSFAIIWKSNVWQIRSKLNFKVHLIRGPLNALTIFYLHTFVAQVVSLSQHAQIDSNSATVVNSTYKEGKRIG